MAEGEVKMKRGELAEQSGVNSETLRFYEKAGLLKPERGANGYRLYGPDDLKRVRLVQRAVDVGFSLEDIKAWLRADTEQLVSALRRVDSKIADLEKLRKALKKRLKA